MMDALAKESVKVGDRVRVSVLGRRATGTVQKVGLRTAAVAVEGDGTWVVAREELAAEVPPPTACRAA